MDRREFTRLAGLGVAALALGCAGDDAKDTADTGDTDTGDTGDTGDTADSGDSGTTDECEPTGADIEGPFYVAGVPIRNDLDLYGDPGTRMRLSGRVTDASCAPLEGAIIEIWHADDAGAYEDEKYRGQVATDADGTYWFTSIVPGRYLNGAQYRPAHIHVKVWVDGVEKLTTQLYFDGDPYNGVDPWYDAARSMAIEEQTDGSIAVEYDFAVI